MDELQIALLGPPHPSAAIMTTKAKWADPIGSCKKGK